MMVICFEMVSVSPFCHFCSKLDSYVYATQAHLFVLKTANQNQQTSSSKTIFTHSLYFTR